jgi:filamentous hemagglutinin family protein
MKRTFLLYQGIPTRKFFLIILILGNLSLWLPCLWAASPITPSGLHTQVSDPIAVGGQTQYDITGGTRPGNGANLFHSFAEFGVPPNNIANFLNGVSFDLNGTPLAAGLQTSNILARVTGDIRSDIYGTIQTTGFGSANLFLMNPNGFLFGPNATVNVGGMVAFTSADYLRLTDGVLFNKTPNVVQDALLSAAPVAAFGFIGSNPQAIDFKGGQLTVAEGTGITLVGGDINLVPDSSGAPSTITTHGRPLQLTSVARAGEGEVAADTGEPAPGMALGTIMLGQGTLLSTAGDSLFEDGSGGAVSIRGGQLVATGATIITSPLGDSVNFSSTGSGGEVTVKVTGSATIADSLFQTSSSLAGRAGAVSITANESLTLTNSFIDSSTSGGRGDSGPATLTTNGPLSLTDSVIVTVSDVSGNSGAVTVRGKDVALNGVAIATAVSGDPDSGLTMVRSGAVTLTAENTLTLSSSPNISSFIGTAATGTLLDASPITITGTTVNIQGSTIDASVSNGSLVSPANGGVIEIRGGNVKVVESQLFSTNSGVEQSTGAGGNIRVLEAEHVNLTASQVNVNATSGGGGGNIEFQTKGLTLSNNTDVSTSSFGAGAGGGITVRGAETVTIESGSRILTDVVIGAPQVPQGTAGDILIETQHLAVLSGGQIGARALPNSTGNAGNIAVHGDGNSPSSSILIDGTGSGIFSTAEGTGAGGNIFVNANSVTLQNGATVSASSTGQIDNPGNAGSIDITATNGLTMQNSAITTQAGQGASGGDIKVTTAPSATVLLENSRISASVADGRGGGGNISIDPQYVILQNSQILAQAAQGQGGAITITITNGGLYLPDANSIVNADSGSGLHGTVTIQSPNAPASGKIQPLGKTPLQATSLLNQHCASLAGGEFSSFTVAGRDSLPIEPGSWLASPLALATLSAGTGIAARGEGLEGMTLGASLAGETALLSLRQIAPAGFLTQAFAVDWSAGCQS